MKLRHAIWPSPLPPSLTQALSLSLSKPLSPQRITTTILRLELAMAYHRTRASGAEPNDAKVVATSSVHC